MRKFIKKINGFIANHTMGVILLLWVSAFIIIPICFKPKSPDNKDQLDYYDVTFASITALFTGIAFAATFSSLENQKKGLQDQIKILDEQTKHLKEQVVIDVFTTTSQNLEHKKFLQSKRHLMSANFYEDIKIVKKLSNKDQISLHDFKICLMNKDSTITPKIKERLSTSYDFILHFCQKMEYMGYLHENMSMSILINYYGRTIKTTYEVLQPLIEIVTNAGEKDFLFVHFSALYYATIKLEPQYLQDRENMIQSFSLKE